MNVRRAAAPPAGADHTARRDPFKTIRGNQFGCREKKVAWEA
jgi:hypothetical protein